MYCGCKCAHVRVCTEIRTLLSVRCPSAPLKVAVSGRGMFFPRSFSSHQKAHFRTCAPWHGGQRTVMNLGTRDWAKRNGERGAGRVSSISAAQNKHWPLQRPSQTDFLERPCVRRSPHHAPYFPSIFYFVSCQMHPLQPRNLRSRFASITSSAF